MDRCDVSVVISTFNRAGELVGALERVLSQETNGVEYEVILVDNNSSDSTRAVVESLMARHPERLRYIFEPRQGLSYGRNTGIAAARGPIIAFTDDDVRVARDWVARIAAVFRERPDISYVGGRVLPRWSVPPPKWLVNHHWSPLALIDYADESIESSANRPVCFVGANLAFRREVFDLVGLFNPQLGRVKDGIGSTEDHDLQIRLWKAGLKGVYQPDLIVTAEVSPDRLTKKYHRRWHQGHGRYCAMMQVHENMIGGNGPIGRDPDLVTLFGSPAFLYAQALTSSLRWLVALVRGPAWRPLYEENRVRYALAYIATRFRMHRAEGTHSPPGEVARFIRELARKKWRRLRSEAARSSQAA
ncbi:MAG TPA: glycosyltransferase [Vicinamibacterales bacterium]|nr:glycosyltransferase [Vicinamibacterales bacterium]